MSPGDGHTERADCSMLDLHREIELLECRRLQAQVFELQLPTPYLKYGIPRIRRDHENGCVCNLSYPQFQVIRCQALDKITESPSQGIH